MHGGLRGTKLEAIPGSPPNLVSLPPGCAFAPRCRYAIDACVQAEIPVTMTPTGGMVRCLRSDTAAATTPQEVSA